MLLCPLGTAGTVEHYQAHSCAFLPLGLPQEGCGCRGQAAGAWECSGQCFLLSGGQMFSLLCGMSPCPQHLGGLTCSLELSNEAARCWCAQVWMEPCLFQRVQEQAGHDGARDQPPGQHPEVLLLPREPDLWAPPALAESRD